MTRCWCVLLLAVAGCGASSAPRAIPGVTFAFEGFVQNSCTVVSLNVCTPATFGTGLPNATKFTGHFTLDSTAIATNAIDQATRRSARYAGVLVDVTIGDKTITGNDVAASYVDIDETLAAETYTVVVPRGFPSGTVAGLSIDYLVITLPIVPSKYPDIKPPMTLSAFQSAVSLQLGAAIALKHNLDPNSWALGLAAPGSIVSGFLSAIH